MWRTRQAGKQLVTLVGLMAHAGVVRCLLAYINSYLARQLSWTKWHCARQSSRAMMMLRGRMHLAGIIGGLLAYIIINGANLLLDKVAECLHWSIAGSDAQPALSGSASGSFITRLQSNTGGAAQVRIHVPLIVMGHEHVTGACESTCICMCSCATSCKDRVVGIFFHGECC